MQAVLAVGFHWLGRALAVLGPLSVVYLLWLLGDTGSFDPLPRSPANQCRVIETGVAISDGVLDAERGLVYLSGFDAAEGALYALDLHAAEPKLQRVTPSDLHDLHPGGLGLYRGADGARALFVIDRHPGAPRVKIFDITDRGAEWRETIADPAFRALRDIAPTGPRQFYASDSSGRLLSALETLLRLPLSDILYFDGTLADPVITGLNTVRGLVLSRGGAMLYVAEALPHRIRVYSRDAEGRLREARRIALRAVPDKLALDAEEQLWLTGQPRLFRLFLHRLDTRFKVPSEVLRLDPAGGEIAVSYADDGDQIADARLAIAADGLVLMAAQGSPRLLLCRPS